MGYLTRREYSRTELHRKLMPYAESDEIDALLEEFRQRGWLSDERYADQIVHARKGKYGSLKVAHELRAQGVSDALIQKAVTELKTDETSTAAALWKKKFGRLPATREEWAKQARFLQSRGFDTDTIRQVLRGSTPDIDEPHD